MSMRQAVAYVGADEKNTNYKREMIDLYAQEHDYEIVDQIDSIDHLLSEAKTGKWDTVIAAKSFSFSRISYTSLQIIAALQQANIKIVTAFGGDDYFNYIDARSMVKAIDNEVNSH